MLLWTLFKFCLNADYFYNVANKGFNIIKIVKLYYPLLLTVYKHKVEVLWGRSMSQDYLRNLVVSGNTLTQEQSIINYINRPTPKKLSP